jgi:DNA ligase-1
MKVYKSRTLFKTRKDGKIQFWFAELEGDKVRAVSGQWENDGPVESSIVRSKWKTLKGTNIGKSNERTPEEQAEFEFNKMQREQLEDGYSETIGVLSMPEKVNPMLAEKYDPKVNYKGWYVQPKLDGVRCIINLAGMWSRQGKPILSAPHIYEELKPLLEKGHVFDGELYNHDLKEDFNKIISLVRKTKPTADDLVESAEKVEYHIYDAIGVGSLSFRDRNQIINIMFSQNEYKKIKQVKTFYLMDSEFEDSTYADFLHDGYEGMMYRNSSAQYEFTRSKNLLKRKEFVDEEFNITDIVEGEGNWSSVAKVVHCEANGKQFKATIKGNFDYCRQLLAEKDQYIGGKVTVRYQNLTPDGIPRFPIATTLYKGERDL